jgi:hypothetical protein
LDVTTHARLLGLGLVVTTVLLGRDIALADPPPPAAAPLDLTWTAPEGCPTGEAVAGEVTRITGGAGGTSRHVTAEARVERKTADAWHATIVMRVDGTVGERSFEAESCAAVADAATLILAIAVNPLVSLRAIPPPPEAPAPAPTPPPVAPPPPPPPPPVPPPPPPPQKPPPPPQRTPPTLGRFAFGLSLAGEAGSLLRAAIGGAMSLAWIPDRFRLELAAGLWVPQEVTSDTYPGVGARFQMLTFGARAAYEVPLGPVTLGPVLGATLRRVSAEGVGGAAALQQSTLSIAPFGGGIATYAIVHGLAVRLLVGVAAPRSRASFVVLDRSSGVETALHETASVTGEATLGLEVHFP